MATTKLTGCPSAIAESSCRVEYPCTLLVFHRRRVLTYSPVSPAPADTALPCGTAEGTGDGVFQTHRLALRPGSAERFLAQRGTHGSETLFVVGAIRGWQGRAERLTQGRRRSEKPCGVLRGFPPV